jgi:hypothetical protein
MARRRVALVLFVAVVGLWSTAALPAVVARQGEAQNDLRVWSEFVALQKSGRIAEEHLRPAYTAKATMLEFLAVMRRGAAWREWERRPEVHRVGPRVHFVIPLSENGARNTYSFTFLLEGGRWFLEHFEGIVVRLDRLGTPPVSVFPDLGEDKKAWMRQEKYWSMMAHVFRTLRQASGTEAAFNIFRDGPGYFVEAKTWVPFYAPERAFIVYLCWEQSRLQGNGVTLERLAANEAVVSIDSIFLRLYTQSGHMRELIEKPDYLRIFETIWEDRARAAGWDVGFTYDGPRCSLRFARTIRSTGEDR